MTILPPQFSLPRYHGAYLGNLIAEIEFLLTGSSVGERLLPELRAHLPQRDGYVLTMFDGLGDNLLSQDVPGFWRDRRAHLDAPFPSTTSVSLATIASGLAPAGHGIVGYYLWVAELGQMVNTLHWTEGSGKPLDFDTTPLLPYPNLWERLSQAGIDTVTVAPPKTRATKLSALLYRGCRQLFSHSWTDWIEQIAAQTRPERLVFGYNYAVDVAAHMHGSRSPECVRAVAEAAQAWRQLSVRLPTNIGLIGTADHGHINIGPAQKQRLGSLGPGVKVGGDPRGLAVRGELSAEAVERYGLQPLAVEQVRSWWGPGSHPDLDRRLPQTLILAPPSQALLPTRFDARMIGHHGGLEPDELHIPLLVSSH